MMFSSSVQARAASAPPSGRPALERKRCSSTAPRRPAASWPPHGSTIGSRHAATPPSHASYGTACGPCPTVRRTCRSQPAAMGRTGAAIPPCRSSSGHTRKPSKTCFPNCPISLSWAIRRSSPPRQADAALSPSRFPMTAPCCKSARDASSTHPAAWPSQESAAAASCLEQTPERISTKTPRPNTQIVTISTKSTGYTASSRIRHQR